MKETFFFLGSARCFHTIDWYESAQDNSDKPVKFVTDMVEGEGFECLVDDRNNLIKLLIIDNLLSNSYGGIGHLLRNIVKLLVVPIQILLVKFKIGSSKKSITFAHSTYYAFLASLAGIKYVSTPQGSEVLVRIEDSSLYKLFAYIAHKNAILITVDSLAMKMKLKDLLNLDSEVVQNGIPIDHLKVITERTEEPKKDDLISIRGIAENYQVLEIIDCCSDSKYLPGLQLCCPFYDDDYFARVQDKVLQTGVVVHGKLNREAFYHCLVRSKIAISIPISDSSPRSVYEAIYCGCIVIVRYNQYLEDLPACMLERIVVTDCAGDWFDVAYEKASEKCKTPFYPTLNADEMYDQKLSFPRVLDSLFTII